MLTWNVAVVAPGANVTVAVFVWKSLPASAVPATVDAVTVTVEVAAADSRIVTFTVEVCTLASVIETSSTERLGVGASLSAIEPVTLDGEPTV
jgi:hypothetical protein